MLTLRGYQIEDANFLKTLTTGACFNEQRTGKTPTILNVIKSKNLTKALIICPASAIPLWVDEYEKWLQQPCAGIIGTKKQKENLIETWTHGLAISYDSFKTTKTSAGFISQILKHSPEIVILDEAHRIKNPKSKNAKAVFSLTSQIENRYALTGTPAPSKPQDIWSILHFLYPERYRSYWRFIDEYFKQTNITLGNGRSFIDIKGFKYGKEKQLQAVLETMSTQRKRREVMQWLPEVDRVQIRLQPTAKQLHYLETLDKYYEAEHIIAKGTLDRLLRYRQICLAPEVLELKGNSPKIDWVKNYLEDYPDTPTIIFSKFTTFLKSLAKKLSAENNLIIGETPIHVRKQRIDHFQNQEIDLLLINIDAGKEALTLDRAEAIIFTDKFPPVGDIAQAEDRFIATTKQKADKPHIIYDLIMKETYEEHLHQLLQKQKSLTDVVNDYKTYRRTNT